MTDAQQKAAAKKFAAHWKGKGYEKGQSQTFCLTLLSEVLGVEDRDPYMDDDLAAFQQKLAGLTFLDIFLQTLIQDRGIIKKYAFAV